MVDRKDGVLRASIERMLKEARARIADSDLLSRDIARESDSDYLLDLLAFEILLKAVYRIHVGKPHGHQYGELFDAIPAEVRSGLVRVAGQRMSTSADYSDIAGLLSLFSRNFIDLRYPYEKYEGLTSEEHAELGRAWIEGGAREEDATFVYRPLELRGLVHALEQHVQGWLDGLRP